MTRPAMITRDCPFCGESEMLSFMDKFSERCLPAASGAYRDDDELVEEVDYIGCDYCMAEAPVDVWNGTRRTDDTADRLAYRAYWLKSKANQAPASEGAP